MLIITEARICYSSSSVNHIKIILITTITTCLMLVPIDTISVHHFISSLLYPSEITTPSSFSDEELRSLKYAQSHPAV